MCFGSRDLSVLNDATKELASYLQLLLRELGKEFVLLKHVPQHAHKEVLCRRRGGERRGGRGGGRGSREEEGRRGKWDFEL